MVNFKEIDKLFSDFTVLDALDCLCWTFNAAQIPVYVDNTRFNLVELYDDAGAVGLNLASSLKLRFLGGPPKRTMWVDSTLYTMLIDFFLNAHAFGDNDVLNKVCKLAKGKKILV